MDEDERARQMQELREQRLETERARLRVQNALEHRNTKLDARRELIEAKRIEVAGGKEAYAAIKADQALEREIGG
jgi:hypothetical protein